MTVKAHYDNHLGNFYSWMAGDLQTAVASFRKFLEENNISAAPGTTAVDLGAGHGIQSLALAEQGFAVHAVDFNEQLIAELQKNADGRNIKVYNDDLRNLEPYRELKPAIVVCCGDTIAHFDSFSELDVFFKNSYELLNPGGKLILSFRDYSNELYENDRFIPVKSDDTRILTCVLDFIEHKVLVTDLLHERNGELWTQKVSSYLKLRITGEGVKDSLTECGFEVGHHSVVKGMHYVIAQKTVDEPKHV